MARHQDIHDLEAPSTLWTDAQCRAVVVMRLDDVLTARMTTMMMTYSEATMTFGTDLCQCRVQEP